jgi:hypothetical protein
MKYTIDGSEYGVKKDCNTLIIAPRWHKHPSRRGSPPSDVAVTLNINAEFNQRFI